ncbi:MAG TPA: glycosyltransferase [bacterium]|nr:glycosyltransferase [bacterium]
MHLLASVIYYALLSVTGAGLVIWAYRLGETYRSGGRDPQLAVDSYTGPAANLPFVSVLIPARNEEKNIRICLESLAALDYPSYEIIVVNDRSTDRTAEIVEDVRSRHPRVTLINNAELRQGWTGKNFALNKGAQAARGDWFLFSDADTCHHPASLTQAVRYVLDEKVDMLTLLPLLEGQSFWENLLQPIAGALLVLSFPIQKSNDPRSKTAFANGQYILIRKDVYREIGGHEALKEYFLEDIAMAKAIKSIGRRLRVVISPDLYRTRMYKSFTEIWNGWTRIFYFIYDKKFTLIALNMVLLFIFSLLPTLLCFATGGWLLFAPELSTRALTLFIASGIEVVVIRMTTFRYYRISRANTYYSILNPIGCVVMLGILGNAIKTIFSKKGMTWRGTTYAKT